MKKKRSVTFLSLSTLLKLLSDSDLSLRYYVRRFDMLIRSATRLFLSFSNAPFLAAKLTGINLIENERVISA